MWLQALYDAIWHRMLDGRYLQVDKTSVPDSTREVQGKNPRGFLWFYAVPGGDAVLVFDARRSLDGVRERLGGFTAQSRPMPMKSTRPCAAGRLGCNKVEVP
jgi:hypothetical protein